MSPEEPWLESAGVQPWMGPDSLPLWLPGPAYAGHARRAARAVREAGLTSRPLRGRPLRDSVADALRWEWEVGLDRSRRAGMGAATEADVLRRWHMEASALPR